MPQMLILSRQAGESVMIGDDVELFVANLSGPSVTLVLRNVTLGGRLTLEDAFEHAAGGRVGLPVGGDCEVVDVRGDKVRLGFSDVPKDISIHRREVYEAIRRENRRERGQP